MKRYQKLFLDNPFPFFLFFIIFFVLDLPESLDLITLQNLTPLQTWAMISVVLVGFAVSCLFSTIYILWISELLDSSKKSNFVSIFKKSLDLMIPMTVVGIRGGLLMALGFLGFILPGIYFYFKYNVVTLVLVLEGWNSTLSPIARTEALMKQHRSVFLKTAIVIVIPTLGFEMSSLFCKFLEIHLSLTTRIFLSALQTSVFLLATLYVTDIFKDLLKKSPELPHRV